MFALSDRGGSDKGGSDERSVPSANLDFHRPLRHTGLSADAPASPRRGARRLARAGTGPPALMQMDSRSLRDAGISPAAAAYESGKPFWKPLGRVR
jgi:uncharacterized protein YjiS (DUF1127 family)